MSYNKTEGIPHDHPLAQLLARSQRANKLPSCEGCKRASVTANEYPRCDNPLTGEYAYTSLTHFCAAWEPKV